MDIFQNLSKLKNLLNDVCCPNVLLVDIRVSRMFDVEAHAKTLSKIIDI